MDEENQNKTAAERVVTEAYFDKKLEAFVTKEYLDQRLKEGRFVTEPYLDERFAAFKVGIDMQFDEFEQKMDEKIQKQTVTIVQAIDSVVTRLDTAEKDRAAHDALHHRIMDDLHDHDGRIKSLETVAG